MEEPAGMVSLGTWAIALSVFQALKRELAGWSMIPVRKYRRTDSALILRRVRSSGVPIILMMCRSWSALSLPRKRGTPEIISAKMHPHDQTSMEVLYVLEPRRTSGARYHKVTTLHITSQVSHGHRDDIAYFVGECVYGNTKGPGQAEISEFELTFPIDEKVLRFQIAMQHSVLVAKGCAHEKLVHEAPHGIRIEGTAVAMRIHVLLEVSLTVLEDKDELRFCVDDIVKAHDVDVLELLHQGDLPNRSRWGSFFSIKVNLFERDDFICCSGTALG